MALASIRFTSRFPSSHSYSPIRSTHLETISSLPQTLSCTSMCYFSRLWSCRTSMIRCYHIDLVGNKASPLPSLEPLS